MRNEKTYNGKLMETGKNNEEIIIKWLNQYGKNIIDFREFRLAQRIDVDCGIETMMLPVKNKKSFDKWNTRAASEAVCPDDCEHKMVGTVFYRQTIV